MSVSDDHLLELQALAASPERRILPAAAAKYLGFSIRTLEDWRLAWRLAEAVGDLALRKGPPFYKIGKKRVLYQVSDLNAYLASCKK
jgi:hypothetical protein